MFGKEVLLSASQVEKIQEEYNFIQENIGKIPQSKSDIEKMLGK